MAASVTHATTAVGTDAGTGEIHKAEWNAGHSVSGVSLEGHDHDGSPEAKLLQANTHETPDTDGSTSALHHTLGTGANQAAAGNDSRLSNQRNPNDHTHAAGSGDGGVLTTPEVSAKILMDNQGGDPSNPASGKISLYTKAAGLFIKTSGGTVVGPMVDATGAGGLTNGTPGLTLGTTNVAGAASTGIATDATVAAFDATAPTTQAFGDSAAVGSAAFAARRDHKHAMPANPVKAGTSNPISPSTGDEFFRSDLGLDIYYDGTRWLTKSEYTHTWGTITAISANQSGRRATGSTYALYLVRAEISYFVSTTNDGSHYWIFDIQDDSGTTIFSSIPNSSAGSANAWTQLTSTAFSSVTLTSKKVVDSFTSKSSTPGTLSFGINLVYRLVVT